MNAHHALFLLSVAGAFTASAAKKPGQVDLTRLNDPATSSAEVQLLLDRDYKNKRYLTEFHWYEAPQRAGQPIHVLLAAYDHGFEREEPSDKPWFRGYKVEDPDQLFNAPDAEPEKIPSITKPSLARIEDHQLFCFDHTGREIRPFGGNNVINGGFIADLNGDGFLERADTTHYGLNGETTAEILNVRTIEKKPQSLLRVVLEWSHRGEDDSDPWTFTCREAEDGKGTKIVFGPGRNEAPTDDRVVFHWNRQREEFEFGELAGTPLQVTASGVKLQDLYKERPVLPKVAKHDPEPPEIVEKPGPAPVPFEYESLKGVDDAGIMAFFNGKPARDSHFRDDGSDEEDAAPTHLPKNFWDLNPKDAALAFAETNRTRAHRNRYRLVVDDRDEIAPPKSGWLVHNYNSAACYTYTTHQFALRFGIEKPFLVHMEHSSQGIVGANPLVDRAAYAMRLLPLSEKETRFLADTIFWLDRIRSRGSTSNAIGGMSSSADGFARLTFFEDGKAPREIANDTVWTTRSIPARWSENYEPETCLNLAEHLLDSAWRDRLGERWNTVPPLQHRNLGTPLEERLKPRQDQDARELLAALAHEAFTIHQRDPLPPSLLLDMVRSAGNEGLVDLGDPLRKLAASLPAPNAEDREFEKLARRFERDHFGAFRHGDPGDDEKRTAWKRYEELREKRQHEPGPVLRDSLAYALRQLESADRPDLLMTWARSLDPGNTWALQRLKAHHPDAHADILSEGFEEADEHGRRRIFTTLAAANPKAALRLRDTFSPEELQALILEVAAFETESDPASLPSRVPALFKIAADPPKKTPWHRDQAMKILEQIDLKKADRDRLDSILLAQLVPPAKPEEDGSPGMGATRTGLPGALAILVKRPDAGRYWEQVVGAIPTIEHYNEFEATRDALVKLPQDDPVKRREALEQLFRHRLQVSDGMMNDVFLSALALDLRGLRNDLQAIATSGPTVRDGLGADFAGGKFTTPRDYRYHAAREVLALWSEPDEDTRSRMWIAFVVKHRYWFEPEKFSRPAREQLQTRATREIDRLPLDRREHIIDNMIAALPPGTPFPDTTRQWLTGVNR